MNRAGWYGFVSYIKSSATSSLLLFAMTDLWNIVKGLAVTVSLDFNGISHTDNTNPILLRLFPVSKFTTNETLVLVKKSRVKFPRWHCFS